MNPNTENIENPNIVENIVNTVFNLEIDLGPPPQMVRHPSYDEYEEVGDVELIADREFQGYNTPNDFVMPTPCPKCYWVCCNEDCSEEKETIEPRRVCFEVEEDSVPLPLPLTRMFTNSHWPQDLPQDLYISEDKKDKVQEGEKQEDEDEDNYLDDYKEEYRYLYKRQEINS